MKKKARKSDTTKAFYIKRRKIKSRPGKQIMVRIKDTTRYFSDKPGKMSWIKKWAKQQYKTRKQKRTTFRKWIQKQADYVRIRHKFKKGLIKRQGPATFSQKEFEGLIDYYKSKGYNYKKARLLAGKQIDQIKKKTKPDKRKTYGVKRPRKKWTKRKKIVKDLIKGLISKYPSIDSNFLKGALNVQPTTMSKLKHDIQEHYIKLLTPVVKDKELIGVLIQHADQWKHRLSYRTQVTGTTKEGQTTSWGQVDKFNCTIEQFVERMRKKKFEENQEWDYNWIFQSLPGLSTSGSPASGFGQNDPGIVKNVDIIIKINTGGKSGIVKELN